MKRALAICGLFCVAFACGRGLPSTSPLGGTLEDESLAAPPYDRKPRSDAAVEPSKPEAAPKAAVPRPAPPDAGIAAKAEAEAPDASSDAGADAGKEAATWAGEYAGSDVTTTRFEGVPGERVQPDDKARTRVEQPAPDRVILHIVDSSSGDTLCSLEARASGSSATIEPQQSCFGNDEIEATVIDGKATLTGDRLEFDLEITLAIDAGDLQMEGEIDYHFDGRRR